MTRQKSIFLPGITCEIVASRLLLLILLTVSSPVLSVDPYEESFNHAISGDYAYLIYAVTWQPTFDLFHSNPKKSGKLEGGGSKTVGFRTHGVWPYYRSRGKQTNRHPSYCTHSPGCPTEKTCALDASVLATFLSKPSFRWIVPSDPEKMMKHEWEKHGTCYGKQQRDYFSDFSNLRAVVKYEDSLLTL